MSDERGMIEFWVPDEELKKLREAKDHYFAFGWDGIQGEHVRRQVECVLYIDGESAKIATRPSFPRLSSVIRSAAWIKATYLSSLNKLASFGKEEKLKHKDAEK